MVFFWQKNGAFVMPVTRYGKQSVPVFKIRKEGPKHSIVDLVVQASESSQDRLVCRG